MEDPSPVEPTPDVGSLPYARREGGTPARIATNGRGYASPSPPSRMHCRRCGAPLERPGDYCLNCNTANADAVVVDFERDRATLTMLRAAEDDHGGEESVEDEVVGETTLTTVPETGEETRVVELRNFAGRVADEIRRKRPEAVYAAGDREVLRETRAQLHYEFLRVKADESEGPVAAVLDRRGDRAPEVVDTPPGEKLGGRHSTLIGGREGRRAIGVVAGHPHVKKIVPGPIDAGGSSTSSGLRAKVTRADETGNVRLLLREGSSVQENRVVTTAGDRATGERVRADLNDALAEAELRT